MRIATLKQVLSIIAVSVVTMLGGREAAAIIIVCPQDTTLHLHANAIPGGTELVLVGTAPTGSVANFLDSPALKRTGQYPYPYTEIAEWDDGYVGSGGGGGGGVGVGCPLPTLGPLHVWLGLRNSDDQGTNFDLLAEVSFKSSAPGSSFVKIVSAEQTCIPGLTRNPALAKEVIMLLPNPPFIPTTGGPLSGDGEYSLTLSARIASPACGGHTNATGLRVYYDSANRDSRFAVDYFNFIPFNP